MKKKSKAKDAPEPVLFGAAPSPAPAASGGLLRFSYSKMSLYEECPLKYKFKYIDKLPEEPKFYFAFGSAIHKALEFLYAVKAPPFPSVEEVCEEFRREWGLKSYLQKGYRTQQKSDADLEKGLAMLRAYYDHNRSLLKPPFLLEYSTDVEVDGLLVRAISDKMEYLGEGRLLVTDYKTGKDVRREPAQLYMYQKIMELDPQLKEKIAEQYGQRVKDVRMERMLYYHVPSNKEYAFQRADDREIGTFWERVLGVAESIRALRFDPTPGERQCAWCDFKKFCPLMGGSQRLSELPAGGDRIEELVDRYGRLKERMDDLRRQLDEAEADVRRAVAKDGEFAGASFTARIEKKQKWEFPDRNGVIEVLNKFDLYEKALNLTLKGITDLLDNPEVPSDARQKLLEQAVKKTVLDIKVERKPGT